MATVNSNHAPLSYRIGDSDRTIGAPTAAPDGFSVLNLKNGKVFVAQSGFWTDGGTMPTPTSPFNFPDLYAAWYGTNSANLNTANNKPALLHNSSGAITGGAGFRIGETNRVIGQAAADPEGFLVLNLKNNLCFKVQGGVWVDGGTFPVDLKNAWLGS